MKNYILGFIAIFFVTSVFVSCSSSGDEPTPDPENLFEYPYSKLSVADQKTKLAKEGESIMKQVVDLPKESSFKLLESFNEIGDGLFDLLGETRSADALKVTKLSKYIGEFEWNAADEQWNKAENSVSDKLIAIFPSNKTSTVNDGRIELTPSGSTVIIKDAEIPAEVKVEFFVKDKKEGQLSVTTTGLNESSYIETANIAATLGTYNLVADVNKKANHNLVGFEFSKGDGRILQGNVNLNAPITTEILNEGSFTFEEANVSLFLGDNLAMMGVVDGKPLQTELNEIFEAEDDLYEKYPWYGGKLGELEKESLALERKKVETLNKYSNIILVSVSEKYRVAKVSFDLDVKETQATGVTYELDENNNPIPETREEYEYTAYDIEEKIILNFSDDTQVEADVFFGNGFSKIIEMWNSFISQFN